jgi:hypothetical protein
MNSHPSPPEDGSVGGTPPRPSHLHHHDHQRQRMSVSVTTAGGLSTTHVGDGEFAGTRAPSQLRLNMSLTEQSSGSGGAGGAAGGAGGGGGVSGGTGPGASVTGYPPEFRMNVNAAYDRRPSASTSNYTDIEQVILASLARETPHAQRFESAGGGSPGDELATTPPDGRSFAGDASALPVALVLAPSGNKSGEFATAAAGSGNMGSSGGSGGGGGGGAGANSAALVSLFSVLSDNNDANDVAGQSTGALMSRRPTNASVFSTTGSRRGSLVPVSRLSIVGGGIVQAPAGSRPNLVSVIATGRSRNDEQSAAFEKALVREECIHDELTAVIDGAFGRFCGYRGKPPGTWHVGHDVELSFRDVAYLFTTITASFGCNVT